MSKRDREIKMDAPEGVGMPDEGKEASHRSTRRTVLRSAAWTVPIIALTVAVPSTSASTLAIDLAVTSIIGPKDQGVGYIDTIITSRGLTLYRYQIGAVLPFTVTYRNFGGPVPAGARLRLTWADSTGAWGDGVVLQTTPGYTVSPATNTIAPNNGNHIVEVALLRPLLTGEQFDVVFGITKTASVATVSTDVTGRILVPIGTPVDTVLGNNALATPELYNEV